MPTFVLKELDISHNIAYLCGVPGSCNLILEMNSLRHDGHNNRNAMIQNKILSFTQHLIFVFPEWDKPHSILLVMDWDAEV